MKSLTTLCIESLISHPHFLTTTIGVPFHAIEPILRVCPISQLLHLEKDDPSLELETGHVWQERLRVKYRIDPGSDYKATYLEEERKVDERRERAVAKLREKKAVKVEERVTGRLGVMHGKTVKGRLTKFILI